jgi:hypothetical protein
MADEDEAATETKQPAEDDDSAAAKAQREEQEVEEARQTMEEIEQGDPPGDLADWPGGKAKYQTYGGPEGESGYDEGATAKLGPSSVRHHEDGKVSIEGEEVDNPDEFKGEPIPGGPSDPDAPPDPAMIGNEDQDDQDDDDGAGSDGSRDESESDSDEDPHAGASRDDE